MKLAIRTFVILVFSVTNALSQKLNPKVTWGEVFELSNRSYIKYLNYLSTGEIVVFAQDVKPSFGNSRQYYFTKLDTNLNPISQTTFKIKNTGLWADKGSRIGYVKTTHLNEEDIILVFIKERKKNTHSIYVRKFDCKSFKFLNEPQLISSYDAGKAEDENIYNYKVKYHKGFLYISHMLPYNPEQDQVVYFDKVDRNGQLMESFTLDANRKQKEFDSNNFFISNNSIYLYDYVWLLPHDTASSKVGGNIVLEFDSLYSLKNEYKFYSSDYKIKNWNTKISDNKLVCYGFYTTYDDKYSNYIRGTFSQSVDLSTGTYSPFLTSDFNETSVTEKFKFKIDKKDEKLWKGDEKLSNYKAGKLFQSSGRYYYLSELRFRDQITAGTPDNTPLLYNEGDILIFNTDSLQQLKWVQRINKFNSSVTTLYLYHSAFLEKNNQLRVFYHKYEGPKLRVFNNVDEDTNFYLSVFDSDGNESAIKLFNRKDSETNVALADIERKSENEYLMFGKSYKSKHKVGRITLD